MTALHLNTSRAWVDARSISPQLTRLEGVEPLNNASMEIERAGTSLPSLFLARPAARTRMRDFFRSHIRNPNTRRAYREAAFQVHDPGTP
ncbi:hypothetical protein [Edaphobacter modestus]|uniref:hypothetical protein n=1 Tax=Edaphobacter modestus TaxID=388466 RepID=UPI00102B6322|nr:hypothetical protein [Edaphobacter modestus]